MSGIGIKKALKDSGAAGWLLVALIAVLLLLLFSNKSGRYADQQADGATELEKRMERVLGKIDGAGGVSVMVQQEKGEIRGVLVVCEGANDLAARIRVQNAVCTLLGIQNEKINVVPMEVDKIEASGGV